MPDPIAPEDRDLINAAIEAGRVTKLEPGISRSAQYVWNPWSHKLVDKEPGKARRGYRTRFTPRDIQIRREKVLERLKAGVSLTGVARELGVTSATISNDRRALSLEGRLK